MHPLANVYKSTVVRIGNMLTSYMTVVRIASFFSLFPFYFVNLLILPIDTTYSFFAHTQSDKVPGFIKQVK